MEDIVQEILTKQDIEQQATYMEDHQQQQTVLHTIKLQTFL